MRPPIRQIFLRHRQEPLRIPVRTGGQEEKRYQGKKGRLYHGFNSSVKVPQRQDVDTGRMVPPKNKPEEKVQREKAQRPLIPIPLEKPLSPALKEALKTTEKNLEDFDQNGYRLSSKFLHHYLKGDGKPLKISPEDIDGASLYKQAIKINQKRFEDSITKGIVDFKHHDGKFVQKTEGTPSAFKDRILKLKDGETINLDNPKVKNAGDSWDRDISRMKSVIYDPDYGRALGAVKLRSLGNLQAARKGNTIEITGEVYHTIKDTYDFNDDTFYDKTEFEPYRLLAKEGRAKPFEVYGHKPQKVTGTLEIKDGRIANPRFRWEDIRE